MWGGNWDLPKALALNGLPADGLRPLSNLANHHVAACQGEPHPACTHEGWEVLHGVDGFAQGSDPFLTGVCSAAAALAG